MASLELRGRSIAGGAVSSLRVVEHLDVVEDVGPGRVSCRVDLPANAFTLEPPICGNTSARTSCSDSCCFISCFPSKTLGTKLAFQLRAQMLSRTALRRRRPYTYIAPSDSTMRISLIGTYHHECGAVTVSALLKIIERIQPDVVFAEIPRTHIDEWRGGSHETVESIAVARYADTHLIDIVAVDSPRPDDEFFQIWEELNRVIERTSPAFRRLMDINTDRTRQGGFAYPYKTASHLVELQIDLQHSDIAKLTPADITLQFGPAAIALEIDTWKDVYGIEERYKAKLCGANDGKYWLTQVLDECRAYDKQPADILAMRAQQALSRPYADCNFLRKPFLEACRQIGIL